MNPQKPDAMEGGSIQVRYQDREEGREDQGEPNEGIGHSNPMPASLLLSENRTLFFSHGYSQVTKWKTCDQDWNHGGLTEAGSPST